MTQWGLDTLFNPAKRHMDEEKRRLQSTREQLSDSSGGKRIDLESGKVTIRRGAANDADADADAADSDAEADANANAADSDAEVAPAEPGSTSSESTFPDSTSSEWRSSESPSPESLSSEPAPPATTEH